MLAPDAAHNPWQESHAESTPMLLPRLQPLREEPGKQKPRSCRAQELARSSVHEMRGVAIGISDNRDGLARVG